MNYQPHLHYNIEIEKCVLGICLMEAGAFPRVYSLLKPEHFYLDDHQTVMHAMSRMFQANIPIDLLTLCDVLMRKDAVKLLGSTNVPYFLASLTNWVTGSAHLEYWCHLLHTLFLEREMIRLTHGGFKSEGDTRQKIGDLQMQLSSLNQQVQVEDWQDMSALIVKMYQNHAAMQDGGIGIKTGFSIPDIQCGGLHPGQLVIIAARPGVGKSAFAGQMAFNAARLGAQVGIVSLEMSDVQIAARIAAIDTSTDYSVIYRGLYKDHHEAESLYNKIGSTTAELPIYVSDKTSVNVLDIRAKAEKLKAKHGLKMLIIDYLQLLDSATGTPNRNREQEVSQMSRGLKIMAKEMGIPVVALCQLNRESLKRKDGDRFPQLSDLRESGAIEQDADVVMFIHSDWATGITQDAEGYSTEGQAHLVCRKWRDAAGNWVLPLHFNGPQMKFSEAGTKPNLILMPQAPAPYDNDENPF